MISQFIISLIHLYLSILFSNPILLISIISLSILFSFFVLKSENEGPPGPDPCEIAS